MENSTKPAAASLAEQEAEKAKTEKIKKIITWITAAVAAVFVIVLIYVFAVRNPGIKKAEAAFSKAYTELSIGNDSLALTDMRAAAEFGGKSGNLAKVYAANMLYENGDYAAALEYYKKADLDDEIAAPGVLGKAGDCLVALGKPEEAISYFDKAVSAADGNPQLVPYFLQKKARVYNNLGKSDEEAKTYDEIIKKYPLSLQAQSAEKYLERAKAAAANK